MRHKIFTRLNETQSNHFNLGAVRHLGFYRKWVNHPHPAWIHTSAYQISAYRSMHASLVATHRFG